mmetsp:Transcript_85227/g.227848  ORF Transcript_85227/g.227848 Transcript_85227/m.227848 type:complete len:217 (+) Transcript_85227:199-849(+)
MLHGCGQCQLHRPRPFAKLSCLDRSKVFHVSVIRPTNSAGTNPGGLLGRYRCFQQHSNRDRVIAVGAECHALLRGRIAKLNPARRGVLRRIFGPLISGADLPLGRRLQAAHMGASQGWCKHQITLIALPTSGSGCTAASAVHSRRHVAYHFCRPNHPDGSGAISCTRSKNRTSVAGVAGRGLRASAQHAPVLGEAVAGPLCRTTTKHAPVLREAAA